MSLAFERVCSVLFDRPHLYHPGKAETLLKMLGPRLTGQNITIVNAPGAVDHVSFANGRPSAGVLGDSMGRRLDQRGIVPFEMIGNVAVIPVEGTLVQKGAWIGSSSGETSYQGLITQFARAERSTAVKGVVVEIDSFGGQVNGAFEAAAALRSLSKAKPTIAILTDFAYSAGYLVASPARQIIMPEFGGAGSIGVVMMHADFSGNLEQEGIKVTFIHAGKRKVDGNPYQPLAAGLQEKWQAEVEQMRDRFAGVVAQGRGKRLSKAAALKTEAEAYSAAEAVELGLVDAVGDSQEAFAAFIKEINGKA
ncbi:S49 family peptidase [Mesorhizobium sp.]|uniref:S49 family peptidase n=1 Tax=Mesorhizobium sp. TaxID=1871066 RepID=UPI000FE595CA|nr:S49 family peptidase [Mesorhizobium sp.]RWO57300.1 MAG: S49 family peptidase [Mesorhizobium sp.]